MVFGSTTLLVYRRSQVAGYAVARRDRALQKKEKGEFAMHMHDWNTYRQQIVDGVGGLAKLSPETVKGYVALSNAGQKTNHLDDKTRELIALAVSVTTRCDGCIAVHTAAARKHGATKEEVAEALGVAIALNAGAALVYTTRALDAFDAAGEV
jgi:AhpD family alkylhydroperoxidase